jgi:spermidine synthase
MDLNLSFIYSSKMPAELDVELTAKLENGVFTETACSADVHSNYPLRKCLWAGKTAFQDVVIAESPTYGKVLFLDGELQSSSSDEAIYHEHLVHPLLSAMSEVSNKRVLVVGGGEGATAREVLRWPAGSVAKVDWVDIDGDLVDLCRQHLGWADDSVYEDPRLSYYPTDINAFLDRKEAALYDAIILDLPDPDVDELKKAGPGSSVLYGAMFNTRILTHLKPDGGLVSHCGPIRPGADDTVCRPGLTWLAVTLFSEGTSSPYHVCIPSFQGEWGFIMNKNAMNYDPILPGLSVWDKLTRSFSFNWPNYWRML